MTTQTNIDEIDAFIKAEIDLIGGEENEDEQMALWKIFYSGIRAIMTAQLQVPTTDDETSDERVKRRIEIIKTYLKEAGHGKPTEQGTR